ncbi:hypothetical protein N431DRAFT_358157 [Stipitochalara longipes BDJ]|nr:hypothetical protein N431DRAFT_358157 [Stipitochalara longipes BDJ]
MNTTALSDCPLNIDPSSYSCTNPFPNCTNPASFQFASLWIITQAIASCPNDTRLFNQLPMLTDASCRLFTHKEPWTPYPAADIWARLTTWKFPLLQLVAVFPRPPLTFLVELFVLVHLLGDPISTIKNLLLKLASCQARALFWKDRFESEEMGLVRRLTGPSSPLILSSAAPSSQPVLLPALSSFEGIWKGLAAIVDSYDEWGSDVGSAAESFILDRLTTGAITNDDQRKFLGICRLTANALAADRSTKFLPIIVAQGFFIGTIAIAFGRTKDSASGPNPATFINIEAHSIAFSSLYFWIIPAVMISSIIGVSQTEAAIPRILKRFRDEVLAAFPDWKDEMHLLKEDLTTELRERSGGIYSWQPKESREAVQNTIRRTDPYRNNPGRGPFATFLQKFAWIITRCITLRPGSESFPVVIFTYSALTGILISYLIPPVGFDCRHAGELSIVLTWVLSACLNNLPIFRNHPSDNEDKRVRARRRRFLFILWKDIIVTALTMGGIIVTQVGVFNRCACYTLWGRAGLALPENGSVSNTLSWRIDTSYPAIAFLCVGFQLVVVPCFLLRQYGLAVRVFLQRDDEKSNLPGWIVSFYEWLVVVWVVLKEGCIKIWRFLSGAFMKLGRRRV